MLDAIKKLFRKSDPETSQEAAEHAQEFLRHHENIILETLGQSGWPSNGQTKSELADRISRFYSIKINDVQVCRRMKKLEEDGKVVRTELKRKNVNGHSETVWRLA